MFEFCWLIVFACLVSCVVLLLMSMGRLVGQLDNMFDLVADVVVCLFLLVCGMNICAVVFLLLFCCLRECGFDLVCLLI